MNDPNLSYRSPLEARNASAQMLRLWSPFHRVHTWRRIWLALAESQHELGLPVSGRQVEEIRAHLQDIDFAAAERHELRLRHDVMAHVHTLGDAAPAARPIIHLGATSQDVVCNADTLIMREGLELLATKLARIIDQLGSFAQTHRALPTLGFTHFQSAQPTTVGKRTAMWCQDFVIALEELEGRCAALRLRGLKGATGTQASFLALFGGDAAKVSALERNFVTRLGWDADAVWGAVGQTYPRTVDAQIVSSLATAAAAIHKCATDIRLLAHLQEVEEPAERSQIGSSAMPYKRNPMRCERACGLARFVMSLPANALATASTQWLERTLDDSSNRRLTLAESFLALDGALDVMANVTAGLIVYPRRIAERLAAEMPFLATEELLMAAVARGADRQDAHEVIRAHSQEAARAVKEHGKPNDLLERLAQEPAFRGIDLQGVLAPERHIGLAAQQVDAFISNCVEPIRQRYRTRVAAGADLRV